jgi:hypothetical protein
MIIDQCMWAVHIYNITHTHSRSSSWFVLNATPVTAPGWHRVPTAATPCPSNLAPSPQGPLRRVHSVPPSLSQLLPDGIDGALFQFIASTCAHTVISPSHDVFCFLLVVFCFLFWFVFFVYLFFVFFFCFFTKSPCKYVFILSQYTYHNVHNAQALKARGSTPWVLRGPPMPLWTPSLPMQQLWPLVVGGHC